MKKPLFLFAISLLALQLPAQSSITDGPWLTLAPVPGEALSVEGNLAEGNLMPTLSWAWNSAVACFPETQASKFTGNPVVSG